MSSSSSRPSRSASETLSAASASSAQPPASPASVEHAAQRCPTSRVDHSRAVLRCWLARAAPSTPHASLGGGRVAALPSALLPSSSALRASAGYVPPPPREAVALNRPSKKRGTATAESTATPVAAPNAAISATGELTATPERLLVMAAAAGGGSGDSGGGDGSVGGGGDGVDGRVGHSAALSLISHAPSLTRQADHKPETRTFA
eukprot:CAMPEP_0185490340 /NCGR_PEP_ID=MMETSP1366-20130426/13880_1 /TAXON_ID=38817 /ORGANISM="Gephyrocapsa oceanica, Strain RCC1303" /LENGTH=204 /DNA_ID=CAMNT_0028099009 /DNA_START=147 /DNA_END=758 /DNA_ORIENTATION=+